MYIPRKLFKGNNGINKNSLLIKWIRPKCNKYFNPCFKERVSFCFSPAHPYVQNKKTIIQDFFLPLHVALVWYLAWSIIRVSCMVCPFLEMDWICACKFLQRFLSFCMLNWFEIRFEALTLLICFGYKFFCLVLLDVLKYVLFICSVHLVMIILKVLFQYHELWMTQKIAYIIFLFKDQN